VRIAVDTTVPIYAVGAESPYRDSCRKLIRRAGAGELVLEASVEMLQEYLHVRARRTGDRLAAAGEARALAQVVRLHDVEAADSRRAIELFATVPTLAASDAVHAATCLNRGIGVLVSADRDHDHVPELRRVDPRSAVAELLGG
jgi:uncharacterized protein